MEGQALEHHAAAYRKVLDVARAVGAGGGRALLVGGSVRDSVLGKISKDFDVEIYGLEAERVEEVVKELGKVSEVGKAFGILKMSLDGGMDIDVSLPRTDSKIGEGHRGFAVKTDPRMSVEDAARRRDFTMNALAADPLTGELFDPFGGVDDLKRRVLRVTDTERFGDDPLRVMRALQFVGRFGLSIEPESRDLMIAMIPELKHLSKERIRIEWEKLFLKSEKPSLGLAAGMALGIFNELHPEFPPLKETGQEKDWHPEGDVWIHTLMAVDEAAKIVRREEMDERQSLCVLLAAFCHDFGKPATTVEEGGRVRSIGHEQAGGEPTKKFLAAMGVGSEMRNRVAALVVNHMRASMLYGDETVRGQQVSDGAVRRLAKDIYPATIRELVALSEADHLGRGPFDDTTDIDGMLMPPNEYPARDWLLTRARRLEVEDSVPVKMTRGRDWIRLGFRPGNDIGRLIRAAEELRDEKGFTREMALGAVSGIGDAKEAIEKLRSLLAR